MKDCESITEIFLEGEKNKKENYANNRNKKMTKKKIREKNCKIVKLIVLKN